MTALAILLAVGLGLLAAPNLLGPLLIHRVQRLRARFDFPALDADTLLAGKDDAFRALDGELRALGFRPVAASMLVDGQVDMGFVLYDHATDPGCASLVRMASRIKTVTFVEFDQLYADGSLLGATNSNEVPVYPRMPAKIGARFPDRPRIADLHAAFVALRAGLRNSAPAVGFGGGEPLRIIGDWLAKEADALVEYGYCHRDIGDDGRRALTWKGAFVLTWRSVFPGRQLRDRLDRASSLRLLRQA